MLVSRVDDGMVVYATSGELSEQLGDESLIDSVGKTVFETGVWQDPDERMAFIDRVRREGRTFRRMDYVDDNGQPRTQYRFARLITLGEREYLAGGAMEVDALRLAEEHDRGSVPARGYADVLRLLHWRGT